MEESGVSAGQPGTPFCHHLPSSIQARAFHFSIQEQQQYAFIRSWQSFGCRDVRF